MLKPLYDNKNGTMRCAGLISGSGSNLCRILEHQQKLIENEGSSPFEVVVILTDNPNSNAYEIGKKFEIPVIVNDIKAFYKKHDRPRSDLTLRAEFDRVSVQLLEKHKVDLAIYAGYMSIVTRPIIEAFLGVNVHPADLSVRENGKRKYTGDHAVRDAILSGEEAIHSSTHLVEVEVDNGPLFIISAPVKVEIPENLSLNNKEDLKEIENFNQERLKVDGDWIIFPKTIEAIARSHYQTDENGVIHYRSMAMPDGVRL